MDISHYQNTAWTFINTLILATEKGHEARMPYRFVVVLTKKINEWKWRLFHDSEPKPQ